MEYTSVVAAMLMFCSAAEAVVGGDDREQVAQVLALSEKPSTKNVQTVERFYASLDIASRSHSPLKTAYGISLIQQRRLHEAAAVFQELADAMPHDLAVRRTQIWLSLTLGKSAQALAHIEDFIHERDDLREAGKRALDDPETVEFFGAVCGFLSGPWSQKVRPATARQLEGRMRARVDDELRVTFDRAKAVVVAHYSELRKTHDERKQNELTAGTKGREEAQEAIDRKTREIGQKELALKGKEAKRAGEADAKFDDIEDQLKEIDAKRRPLLAQIVPLEAQRLALVSQLLPEQTPQAPPQLVANNPSEYQADLRAFRVEERSFQANVAAFGADVQHNRVIRRLLAPVVTRLNGLEAQVAVLNQRELELLAERGATGIKLQFEFAKLAQKKQVLEKDKKHLDSDLKRLKAKPVSYSARLRAETQQLTRFSTYVPFAFAKEKERLLKETRE